MGGLRGTHFKMNFIISIQNILLKWENMFINWFEGNTWNLILFSHYDFEMCLIIWIEKFFSETSRLSEIEPSVF